MSMDSDSIIAELKLVNLKRRELLPEGRMDVCTEGYKLEDRHYGPASCIQRCNLMEKGLVRSDWDQPSASRWGRIWWRDTEIPQESQVMSHECRS